MDTTIEQRRNNGLTQTIIVGIIALIVGYLLGSSVNKPTENSGVVGTSMKDTEQNQANNAAVTTETKTTTTTATPGATASSTTSNSTDRSFSIPVSSLPQAQQTMLKTMGMKDANIVITNAMVVCADQKFGATRVNEFKGGATPSVSEGIGLMACYTGNN